MGLICTFIPCMSTDYPQTFVIFVSVCFGIFISKNATHSMKQDLILLAFNSPPPAGVCQKFRWPGALLGWPNKRHRLSRSRVATDWPFGSFSLKIDSHWPALGFENMVLYVPGPPHTVHSTILIITTLNEDLHTGLNYKHTKEMGCSSASQYEVCYWFAGDEAYHWCSIILRKEFLGAMLDSSQ